MNINFNSSRGFGSSFRSQSTRLGAVGSLNPSYPGLNGSSTNMLSSTSTAYQPAASVTPASAADCRDLCNDNGVQEYRHGSSTDGNIGVQGDSKNGKGGLGINGDHRESEVCICYSPQKSTQCSVSM